MRSICCAVLILAFAGCDSAPISGSDASRFDAAIPRADAGARRDVGTPIFGDPGCGLDQAAFCDTFDAITGVRGRAGDLDASRWSASRSNPQFASGNDARIAIGETTVSGCRADLPAKVLPPHDAAICDANENIRSPHLLVAVGAESYGQNSYRIRQPFDFTDRVGRIVFDAEGFFLHSLLGWISISITEDPTPAPSFSIGVENQNNDEGGAAPRNGVEIHLQATCPGAAAGSFGVRFIDVLREYQDEIHAPQNPHCVSGLEGRLNHFEVELSRTHVAIYATPASDDGVTFAPLELLAEADIDLPFERGYVHFTTHNHATRKYTPGHGSARFLDGWITRWDNVGFDGPWIDSTREYEIPDSLVPTTMGWNLIGVPSVGVAYVIPDESAGAAQSLSFEGVDLASATQARLAISGWYLIRPRSELEAYMLRYRFNGGTWRERAFTESELGLLAGGHSQGAIGQMLEVPLEDLVPGTNTLELTTRDVPQGYPPLASAIDLILETR